jgi:hypothetical protein
MRTITITVEREDVYQSLKKDLEKYEEGMLEVFDNWSTNEALDKKISEALVGVSNGETRDLKDVLAEARAKYGLQG